MAALNSAFALTNAEECMLPAAGASPISEITPVPAKADTSDVEPAQSPAGGPPVLLCIADSLLCRTSSYVGLRGTCRCP